MKEVEEIRAKLEFIYQIPFINPPKLFELTGDKWLTYQTLKEEHEDIYAAYSHLSTAVRH